MWELQVLVVLLLLLLLMFLWLWRRFGTRSGDSLDRWERGEVGGVVGLVDDELGKTHQRGQVLLRPGMLADLLHRNSLRGILLEYPVHQINQFYWNAI